MKSTLTIVAIFTFLFSYSQVTDWIANEPGTGVDVDVDPLNNSYTCAQIVGTVQIGGNTFTSFGSQDVIVQKHSSNGNVLWATQIGGPNGDFSSKIVYDGFGSVWVSGQFSGTLNAGSFTLNAVGGSDVFLVKLNAANGLVLFAESGGGTGTDGPADLSTDGSGNIYFTGNFNNSFTFGSSTLPGSGSSDFSLVKVNNSGIVVLDFGITGSGVESSWTSTVDQFGNIYFGGFTTSSSVSYNGTNVSYSGTTHFFAKFNSSGALQWASEAFFNGEVYGLSVDAAGSVYFTGNFDTSADFGPISLTNGANDNALLGKLNSNGSYSWVNHYGGTGSDQGYDLKCKSNGDLYLVGTYQGSFNFGSIPMSTGAFSRTYLAKLDSTGQEIWVQVSEGASGSHNCQGVAINTADDIFITGSGGGFFQMGGDTSTLSTSFLINLKDNANEITGYVFSDGNNNGVFDSGETGIPNVILQSNGNHLGTSGFNGHFSLYTSSGNYSVSIPNPPLYHTLTTAASQNVNFPNMGNIDSLNHFGYYPIPNVNDLRIDITPATSVKAGYVLSYMITYKNVGTTTLSPIVTLSSDADLVYINSSPVEDSQVGQLATWDIGSLAPGEMGTIHAQFNIPSNMNIGDTLVSTAEITPVSGDSVVVDNSMTNTSYVTGPYDPNYKKVNIDTLYNISSSNWLEYTVHFQNVGNDTAYNVVIVDTMSSYLDLATMEILASSHTPMNFSLSNGNVAEFRFDNIFLPDSTTDQVGSNGFVKFRVKYLASLPVNESIENFVDIYFDFNAPVRTNTATTIHIDSTLSIADFQKESNVLIYPNPFSSDVSVRFAETLNEPVQIQIFDLTGKLVHQQTIATSSGSKNLKLDLKHFKTGFYFLKMTASKMQITRKIVKH